MSYPIYRHPVDEIPPLSSFSPIVQLIREHVQKVRFDLFITLSFLSERDTHKKVLNFPVNHVLIQHYRSGADYISDHSDKTIDVIRNSSIANVSLGAQRIMTLRLKRNKRKQR